MTSDIIHVLWRSDHVFTAALTISWGMSVCVSLCPAVRFRISQRIFSKFGGNILWVMTRIMGYSLLCARNACACVLNVCTCVLNASACLNSLICIWIISKFAGNILRLTTSDKDYVLFMVTHHAGERACVQARVVESTRD
jgi:hypothetical protein